MPREPSCPQWPYNFGGHGGKAVSQCHESAKTLYVIPREPSCPHTESAEKRSSAAIPN